MFGLRISCLDAGYGRDSTAKSGPAIWGVERTHPSGRRHRSEVVHDEWGVFLRGPHVLARWESYRPW